MRNNSGKIKIGHVITRMIIGGAQENTLFTVQGLAENEKYDVDLITGPETGPEGDLTYQIGERVKYRVLPIHFLRRNINPFYDMTAFICLYRLFCREKYDIVHTHSSKAGIIGRFAANLAGVPVIVHTIHGLPFHAFQSRMVHEIYRRAEKSAAKVTDKIITVADAMTDQAVQAGVAGPEKFMTIHSGMVLEPFLRRDYDLPLLRGKFGLMPEDIVIGKVARLFHLKGHEYLIDAAKDIVKFFPKVKFLLIGDGILKNDLEKRIQEAGLSNHFVFAGLIAPEKVPEAIAVMDIVVHTSLREGLAKVIPQALALGKPVVSFNLDGASEVIENGKNGFLIPARDTASLSKAVIQLLQNPELMKKMGSEGLKKVDPFFRKEYMVSRLDVLYEKIRKEKNL